MRLDGSANNDSQLVLIRHGHTEHNGGSTEPRLMGVYDVELSELGVRQAQYLAAALSASGERFAAICTSPLRRARRTAQVLVDRGLGPLVVCAELSEIDCGELEGKTLREVQTVYAAAWEQNLRQDDPDFRWPGGESYREFRARSLRALAHIAACYGGQRVAVVTHAGVISQVVGASRGVGAACWEAYRPGNTAMTTLRAGPHGTRIERFDDRAHLEILVGGSGTALR